MFGYFLSYKNNIDLIEIRVWPYRPPTEPTHSCQHESTSNQCLEPTHTKLWVCSNWMMYAGPGPCWRGVKKQSTFHLWWVRRQRESHQGWKADVLAKTKANVPPPQNATQSPQIRCASQLQKRQEHNLCPDYDRLFYSTSRHSWGDLTFRSVTIDLQMSKCGKNASSLTAKSVRLPKPCETDARVLERLAIMILATLLWSAGIIFRWLWNATRLQMRNKKTRYMIKG